MRKLVRSIQVIFIIFFLFVTIIDKKYDVVVAAAEDDDMETASERRATTTATTTSAAAAVTAASNEDELQVNSNLEKEGNEIFYEEINEIDEKNNNENISDTSSTLVLPSLDEDKEGEDKTEKNDDSSRNTATVTADQVLSHGHWGTFPISSSTSTKNENLNNNGGAEHHIPFVPNSHAKGNWNDTGIPSSSASQHTIHKQYYYAPPDGFTFTARITSSSEFVDVTTTTPTNKNNNYPKNKQEKEKILSIPYIECNNIGTTTPSIHNHATFRHFPKSGAHPTTFTKILGMIIPLSPIEIQINNKKGESRIFYPGQIIWSDGGECKMTAPNGSDDDLSVLILNVDKKYIESQTKNGILFGNDINGGGRYSCFIGSSSSGGYTATNTSSNNNSNNGGKVMLGDITGVGIDGVSDDIIMDKEIRLGAAFVDAVKKIPTRKVILSSVGISLSTVFAYFLSKVAPLQLAVGVGGLCLVTGGTYATILGGEWLCEEMEKAWEDVHNSGIIVDNNDLDDDNAEDMNFDGTQNIVEEELSFN